MSIDENVFFRESTLRICGSLEIDKALWQLFLYISDFIPAYRMSLTIYDRPRGVTEYIAWVDAEGPNVVNFEVQQEPEIRRVIERWYDNPEQESPVRIIDSVYADETMGPIQKKIGRPDATVLQMRLKLEGELLGNLHVIQKEGVIYTQDHAHLLGLLNEPCAIALSNYLRYREVLKLKELLADDNRYLHEELHSQVGEEIVGADFGLKEVINLVRQVAPLTSPVLLLGETGTGKEVIANTIHNLSPRRDAPFIKVNCGAIPETLIESELFGHEKGAFTGALFQKRGRFERAQNGTVFLDEIGELPAEAQVRLLRVLQEKEIERVGGQNPIKVDVRIIAATHRNLEVMLGEERFREDLYFRLKVFPITIPPLRDRIEDIPALVHYFIRKRSQEMGLVDVPNLSTNAIRSLKSYHWPGNVRELQNTVERALILSRGEPFLSLDIPSAVSQVIPDNQEIEDVESWALNDVISNHIEKALKITKGKVHGEAGAAQLLNINPSTLRKKMKKLDIPFGRNLKRDLSLIDL